MKKLVAIDVAMCLLATAGLLLWSLRVTEPIASQLIISAAVGIAAGLSIGRLFTRHNDTDARIEAHLAIARVMLEEMVGDRGPGLPSILPPDLRQRFEDGDPVPVVGMMFTGIYDADLAQRALQALTDVGETSDPVVGAHAFSITPHYPELPE